MLKKGERDRNSVWAALRQFCWVPRRSRRQRKWKEGRPKISVIVLRRKELDYLDIFGGVEESDEESDDEDEMEIDMNECNLWM